MSWNTIGFSKLLEVTAKDMEVIKENLKAVYVGDNKLTDQEKAVFIADSFLTIDHWSSYYKQYKEILDHEVETLKAENIMLKERLVMMEKVLEAKDNNNGLVQVDIVDMVDTLEKAVSLIEENAKALTLSRKLKTEPKVSKYGKEHPKFNTRVNNDSLVADYKELLKYNEEHPNKEEQKAVLRELAEKYGLSLPGIRNRLIALGEYQAKYNTNK